MKCFPQVGNSIRETEGVFLYTQFVTKDSSIEIMNWVYKKGNLEWRLKII